MSEELDRKIAERVMGEEEPPKISFEVEDECEVDLWPTISDGGNWWCHPRRSWTPRPFSTSLDLAMKALHKWLENWAEVNELPYPQIWFNYTLNSADPWYAEFTLVGVDARGSTLTEAICNLLLALVEEK